MALVLAATILAAPVYASVTAELQAIARGATFEVVLRKQESDQLSYEKPLPLDLIPYIERTDRYHSVGTAFALGDNTFVSASHVMILGVGSQFGTPLLRDSAGRVYAVDKVLKYSQQEDFIVFTVVAPPQARPLVPAEGAGIDDAVYAVGNALGEGVVIRDGLFTSETPEDQEGRWKWMRFSAAASPGNSGGPLLASDGRVLGVVLAKSQNENLNYALPIRRVLQDAGKAASFGAREVFGLPMLQDRITVAMDGGIALPKSYADFAREFRAAVAAHQQKAIDRLLTSSSASLFPRGQSQKLLATFNAVYSPRLVLQNADRIWEAQEINYASTDLGGDGFIETGDRGGYTLFHLRRPDHATSAEFYTDAAKLSQSILKGLKLPRPVGGDAVRITSLGPAAVSATHKDHYGRQWRHYAWPLGYADVWVVGLLLPVPDGYVGLIGLSSSLVLDSNIALMKLMSDYFYVSYSGTLPQWKAFLARPDLRPTAFDDVRFTFNETAGLEFSSPRFSARLAVEAAKIGSRTELDVHMHYLPDGSRLRWEVFGLRIKQDWDKQSFLDLSRVPRPGEGAGKEAELRWQYMLKRSDAFSGMAWPSSDLKYMWITTVLDATQKVRGDFSDDSSVLYALTCATDRQLLPRELYDMQRAAIQGIHILEK